MRAPGQAGGNGWCGRSKSQGEIHEENVGSHPPVILCLPGHAAADPTKKCKDDILKGQYVFTASGFTRPPPSGPNTPWVPKAILEVLHFNGDGTLSTPSVTVANPFGDSGAILQPGPGADGTYSINDDCTGAVVFADAASPETHAWLSR